MPHYCKPVYSEQKLFILTEVLMCAVLHTMFFFHTKYIFFMKKSSSYCVSYILAHEYKQSPLSTTCLSAIVASKGLIETLLSNLPRLRKRDFMYLMEGHIPVKTAQRVAFVSHIPKFR